MTYNVFGGTLNPTFSSSYLTQLLACNAPWQCWATVAQRSNGLQLRDAPDI